MSEAANPQEGDSRLNDYLRGVPVDLCGHHRKLRFILGAISDWEKASGRQPRILDLGCGTGSVITRHVAGFGYPVIGLDSNAPTIALAQSAGFDSKAEFICGTLSEVGGEFDIILLIEVLEHIAEPLGFLREVRGRLRDDGLLIITVPNGFGPFEIESWLWRALYMDRVWTRNVAPWLKRVLGKVEGGTDRQGALVNSLDESPHVNFFTPRRIGVLLSNAGFQVGGFGTSSVLTGPFTLTFLPGWRWLLRLNSSLGDVVPKWAVNGHYYTATPGSVSRVNDSGFTACLPA